MSDLSSTQDELAYNLHRLQQMRQKPIQMRYVYYCMQLWHALFSDNTSCSGIAACQWS